MIKNIFNRREFLGASAAWLTWNSLSSQAWAGGESSTDILIVGSGLGGCAATLAALRRGKRVILTEETDWIGGQMTSQAVPPDEHPWIEQFGCTRSYRKLRDDIRDYYRRNYPLTAEARSIKNLNPGGGSVSRLCCEPRVVLAVLLEQMAPYLASGRLRLLTECRATAVETEGDRVRSVKLRHDDGRTMTVQAPYVLDATELGDLLPMAKVEYVAGAESQDIYGEPHASTRPGPENQQAFTCCFAVDYLENEDHTIEKPAEYDFWKNYAPDLKPAWTGKLLSWTMSHPITLQPREVFFDPTLKPTPGLNLWIYRKIIQKSHYANGAFASDATLVNWPQNDYWLGNLAEVTPEEAAKHLERAKQLSLSLVYWMQTEAPRTDGKQGWKGLRLRGDLLGSRDGLAKSPYIRESRRIKAEFTVTENQIGLDARMKKTGKPRESVTAEVFDDSVGVGSYRIDLHPSSGGDNYIDVGSLPFQIPLGSLIPIRIENLLPACKNLGVTHITNGCYRLHPVEWNIGEAAGALAAYCLDHRLAPRQVRRNVKRLRDFQTNLRSDGFELEWPQLRPL